jgi:hypothetical protein
MINAAAAAAGLRYLNDAGTNRTVDGFLPDDDLSPRDPEVAVVRHAQAGDYEQMRFFRQNLFVHHNQKPRRVPVLAALDTLYVAGHFEPTDEEGGLQRGEARFVLRDPALTAALLRLSDHWPRYVRFSDVFAGEEARKGVLELWHKGLIFLSPTAERFALEPGERPSTSPLVRALIATGSERLCTLSHEVILVGDPVARELLTALDGAHDRQQLAQIWSGLAHNPELTLDAALGALAAKRLLRSG